MHPFNIQSQNHNSWCARASVSSLLIDRNIPASAPKILILIQAWCPVGFRTNTDLYSTSNPNIYRFRRNHIIIPVHHSWNDYLWVIFFSTILVLLNTLRPSQNGRHFADDIFKRTFVNENVRISIKISLKFFPKGPINNIPAMVQIMAWRRPGDKPLFETMMVCLPTHICVTRPQWVKSEEASMDIC